MNIVRALRTPSLTRSHHYNRYTGGLARRATLAQPPSRYGRAFSTEVEEGKEGKEVKEELDDVDPRDLEETLEALKDQQIALLGDKITEMKGNWQRALAETDNLTKKMHKDVAQARDHSAEKMVRQLLVVSDTLDFCLRSKPNFEDPDLKENSEAKGAFDGLEAAKKHFVSALKSVNVHEIVPQLGDTFDPMLHNACFEVEGNDQALPGQIGLVVKSGWVKENTLIRAADVGVVKAKEFPTLDSLPSEQ
eukprot:TRINITY_DN211_c0_g1_i5.p1 TRINITY_DN211_c0_g1~~TRINITY_DN211_c0_g1_i5.p1  ORF type:complete len:278 (-),score=56.03 TRINITY_DN211_c0_g1_i5:177-923(-)